MPKESQGKQQTDLKNLKIKPDEVDPKLAKVLTEEYILSSTFYFSKIILDRDLLTEEEHLYLCNFLDNDIPGQDKAFKLVLMPRLTFKSTIVSFAYLIKRIIQNPDIRILIASENYSTALDYLQKIKKEFEVNEKIRNFYGNFVAKHGWTDESITVAKRKINEKEPTIMCAGVEKTVTGYHYDLICGDDLVSKNNVTTADQIKKVIDFYKDFNNLLDRTKEKPEILICGTRWHFSDLYQHIQDNEKEDFSILNVGAYKEDGSLRFPSILTKEELERLRRSQGSYLFSCNYLNSPVDEENAKFRKDWIRYYSFSLGGKLVPKLTEKEERSHKEEHRDYYHLKDCRIYIHLDPATSDRKTGDYTGIIVSAISPEDFIYVIEAKREKINLTQIIKKLFDLYKKYNPKKILLETQATQAMIKFPLFEEQKIRRVYLPIEWISHSWKIRKEDRIAELVPRFEFGTIFIKPDMGDLEDELIRFPVGQHDDLIDSLSFGLPYWRKPELYRKSEIPKNSFKGIMLRKQGDGKDMFKSYVSKRLIGV
jgi:predicted phage terminase large subunit-like protein